MRGRAFHIFGFEGAFAYKLGLVATQREQKVAWGYAYPSPSLADPGGSDTLVAAVQWLQGTLLGTVATTVAVICVATVGLMMLSGRVDLRRGASVIVGCFILFGASGIAAGIQSVAGTDASPREAFAEADLWVPPPLPPPPPAAPADPYAGAAVPARCTAEEATRLADRCGRGGTP